MTMHELLPFAEVRDLIFQQGHPFCDSNHYAERASDDERCALAWLRETHVQEIERT